MLVLPFFISLVGQKGIRKMNSKTKQFFQFVFSRGFLKQIGLMLVVLFILIFLTFMFIRFYTNHGEAVEVPALKGLTMEEAGLLLLITICNMKSLILYMMQKLSEDL